LGCSHRTSVVTRLRLQEMKKRNRPNSHGPWKNFFFVTGPWKNCSPAFTPVPFSSPVHLAYTLPSLPHSTVFCIYGASERHRPRVSEQPNKPATAAALAPAPSCPGLRQTLCRRRAPTTPGMPAPLSSLLCVQN
jgi:hypothetical protein